MEAVSEFLNKLTSKGVRVSAEAGRLNCYAPKGTLTDDLKDGIIRYKAAIITLLEDREKGRQAQTDQSSPGQPKEFPLSVGQKGLYILQKLHPGMGAYNVPLCFTIHGEIDTGLMAKAWSYVLEQFPILMARVIERDGALYQRLDEGCRTTLQRRAVDFADDQYLLSFVRKRAKEPFDLNRGPLTRIELFTRDERNSVLLITVHHIVFDGSSAVILLRNLRTFYQQLLEGKQVRLSRELTGYQEFVAWEEAMLASAEGASHAAYWKQQLNGELPVFELPSESPRVGPPSFEGETIVEDLPEDLSRWIHGFARAHSLPPSVFFLALFQLVLHKRSDQDEIIVGMPVMGRSEEKFAADVGYFVNMIPLRIRCGERLKLKEFLRKAQGVMLDGLYHSSYPFPLMLDMLESRQARKDPVFQVSYAYQNFIKQPLAGQPPAGLLPQPQAIQIESMLEISQEGEFDLGLEIFENPTSFSLRLKFNPDAYTQRTARRLLEHYHELLKAVSRDPDLFTHEYSIVTEQERQRLLVDNNDTRAEYPKDKCIHHLFEEQVSVSPDRTAVVFDGQELSYRELYDKSHDLALYLQSLGVGPDSIVGLCLERSIEMMVAIMGTALAGGAYLPLDPDYPDERLAYMIEDSGSPVLLTQRKWEGRVGALSGGETRLVALDAEWSEVSERVAALKREKAPLRREVGSHNLCYVIYTSGSTGKPKGVLVEHRALVNRIHWMQKRYALDRSDVILQKTPYSFDVSVWEFFWPMMAGASVVFAVAGGHKDAGYLEELINEAKVTTLHFVPSMLYSFLENARSECGGVRRVFCSGEALDKKGVDRYKTRFPNAALHNLYGPTEAAIDVTAFDCSQLSYPFVPIGAPIDNIQIHILDGRNRLQPMGVPGELHIAGDGLARGYLNRPELTEEKFVANPFEPGGRMYKTGDLARWLEDGAIQYLGRIDTQVKIRGFRIELGEIEAQLNQHPQVQDCAVASQGEGAEKRLIAFYRAKETTADYLVQLPNEELRAHLLRTLPEYMAPVAFVSLAAIPLSSNGKVDRRALARMDVAMESGREYLAPRNETEKRLVEIWAEVLNLTPEKIGVNDNFFELGGNSLLATQLISKIRSQMNVDLPLKTLFDQTSVAQLAEDIATAEQNEIPPIRPIDRGRFERLPLSFAQERLWFINQLDPDGAGYNSPGAAILRDELDVNRLEEAFNLIIARHEGLRTVFPSEEGQARQRILDRLDFKLERFDLRSYLSKEARDHKAKEICQSDAATPFDLASGPLIRGKVITLASDEHIVMVNMSHIISDGWSLGVLIKELGVIMEAFRQGRRPELAPLPIQYVDYSVWQRQWLEESGTLSRLLAYWQEKLSGLPESLDLATDYPRPSVQSFAGARQALTLDERLTARLKFLAEQQGCTLYMVLLAAFKTLLHRYTGQTDICVGSPIANRQYVETEGLIGMLVNTLALRTQVEGEDRFTSLLSKVRATCLEAYEHQDAPFEKVVDALRPKRNLAVSPLFQVMMVLQNVNVGRPDPHVQRYPLESGVSKFDLTVEFTEDQEGLAGSVEYSTALFKPQTIERMVGHFTALCHAITVTPTANIRDLDYLREAEKRRLLVDYNDTRAEYSKDKCIHHLFEEQVAVSPDRMAVVFGGQSLRYRELYDKSHDLALYLQSLGVGPDSIVGLCLERSSEMVVAIMGTALAGGAYLPLDPDYPDERLAYMIEDSGSSVLLTQRKWEGRIGALSGGETRLVALDAGSPEVSERAAALKREKAPLRRDVRPHNLCYVLYTSGSTGNPKGVMVPHSAISNHMQWMQRTLAFNHMDCVLQKTPFSFDASVWEFYAPLLSGGRLVMAQPGGHRDCSYLLKVMREEAVTTLQVVPMLLRMILEEEGLEECRSLKRLFCGGEPLERDLVERLRERLSEVEIYNLYGPTETTIDVTAFDCSQLKYPFVPIGAPIDNIRIYILDQDDRLQPIGVPGELHIAGDGLARGYLSRPELTEEKFVANPFEPGGRMYKTGDLARWLEDGNIQYLGRIDTQVKIRGFRIELGEIEARLNQYPGIQESAVAPQGEGAEKWLIAFYRAKETTADHLVQLPNEELRAHLLRTLPEYMAPAAFVSLAAIPLSSNGKVDRRALTRMDVAMESGREYLAPRNETEKRLVEIWVEVLNLAPEKVGVNDNFFELGGHSLLATRLISKIRSQMNVDLPLKALFERGSVAQLAQLIAKAEKSEIPPIQPVDRAQFDRLPLSFAQERLWFINQLEPDSPGYNVPGAAAIQGELDIDQLEQAFNLIIARHENLRTLFPSQEGLAHQQILDLVDFKLERIDLGHYTDKNARDNEAKQLCRTDAATPFDLAGGPLIRGKVIKLAVDDHILMLNMHHIISDGWSLGVLVKELRVILDAFRQGRRPELAPLPIQYVDYSVWQRNWLEEGGVLTRQLSYWQEKLAGVPESLDLATDYPRPSVQSFAGARQAFTLDERLTARLKVLAEPQGCTLYMVLLAAFKVLLRRYTSQSDLCVGSPIANRQYGETEGLIGMFVNTLALRTQVEGRDTIAALLAKVKTTCLEAYEHQDAPFEKVVDLLRLQRNLAISPLFQVMMILQNADQRADGSAEDRHIRPYPLESGISKFDLTVEFTETSAGLAGSIEYSTALFKPQTIGRMADHFIALCRSITVTPTARICDLDYLGDAEKRRLLVDYNDTRADYPKDKCLHRLFAEQAAVNAGRTAVVCGDEQLTHWQLYERSRDLALYLQSQGVEPDGLVGLCMERSLDMAVGLLGILQAGGAYVPLDPDYPDERLAYMLQDSRVGIVLTQERLQDKLTALGGKEVEVIALDQQWPRINDRVADLKAQKAQLDDRAKPDNLAYVIYTSGSTGKPKGVMVEHKSLVNYLTYCINNYVSPGNNAYASFLHFPLTFDASITSLFAPLIIGRAIDVNPKGNIDTFKEGEFLNRGYDFIKLTPSHLLLLRSNSSNVPEEYFQKKNLLVVGGEALTQDHVDFLARPNVDIEIVNEYGPTEATVGCTTYRFSIGKSEQEGSKSVANITIGAPIANTQIYILDQYNNPQPIGVPGELHIAGDGLARGYLNRPELTREKFVANPFIPGARMYKSGDLARWLDDGSLEYLGRIDTQVKIRGFRIETGEIEARLNQHPGIQDSAVIARGQGADKRLIAFYRAKETQADRLVQLPSEELRTHLLRMLPDYMAPAAYVSLAEIPLNPNGKVDRRALAGMDVTMASGEIYVAPRNETEQRLVAIWAEVLNVAPEKIGINDNFFGLGGHSLSAVQLMAKTNRYFEQMLPLAVLFTAPNIAAFAKLISNEDAPSFDILVPIQTDGDAPPVFAVPGVGGNVLSLEPLSKVLGANQPFFGLQAVGLDGKRPPLDSVEQTAQANIAALKTIQPGDPYSLIGHSYGGVVAYEMARILLEQGEGVSSLILLDSIAPEIMQRNLAHDEVAELVEACMAVADIYGARPEIDVERLLRLSDEEKVHNLAGLLNDRGLEIDCEQFAAFYRVYRANLLCYRAYTPPPLSREIDVSLYRATQGRPDRLNLPPDYGWGRLLQRPIRIYNVEADHFSILKKVSITQKV